MKPVGMCDMNKVLFSCRLTTWLLWLRHKCIKAGSIPESKEQSEDIRNLGASIIKRLHETGSAPRSFHFLDRKIQQISPTE